jgi:hypothetical protein
MEFEMKRFSALVVLLGILTALPAFADNSTVRLYRSANNNNIILLFGDFSNPQELQFYTGSIENGQSSALIQMEVIEGKLYKDSEKISLSFQNPARGRSRIGDLYISISASGLGANGGNATLGQHGVLGQSTYRKVLLNDKLLKQLPVANPLGLAGAQSTALDIIEDWQRSHSQQQQNAPSPVDGLFDGAAVSPQQKALQMEFIKQSTPQVLGAITANLNSYGQLTDMHDQLALIIQRADVSTLQYILLNIFIRPDAENMEDLIILAIKKAEGNNSLMHRIGSDVLKQPHAKDMRRAMALFISVADKSSLEFFVGVALTKRHNFQKYTILGLAIEKQVWNFYGGIRSVLTEWKAFGTREGQELFMASTEADPNVRREKVAEVLKQLGQPPTSTLSAPAANPCIGAIGGALGKGRLPL